MATSQDSGVIRLLKDWMKSDTGYIIALCEVYLMTNSFGRKRKRIGITI